MAEEWRIVVLAGMGFKSRERVFEPSDGRGLVAARSRERLLRRESARLELSLRQQPTQDHPPKEHFENPRHFELMPIERTDDKEIQMVANLRQVPVAGPLVAACVQAIEFSADGRTIGKAQFARRHWAATSTLAGARAGTDGRIRSSSGR